MEIFWGGGGHILIIGTNIYKSSINILQHFANTSLALYTFDPTTETKDTSEHG